MFKTKNEGSYTRTASPAVRALAAEIAGTMDAFSEPINVTAGESEIIVDDMNGVSLLKVDVSAFYVTHPLYLQGLASKILDVYRFATTRKVYSDEERLLLVDATNTAIDDLLSGGLRLYDGAGETLVDGEKLSVEAVVLHAEALKAQQARERAGNRGGLWVDVTAAYQVADTFGTALSQVLPVAMSPTFIVGPGTVRVAIAGNREVLIHVPVGTDVAAAAPDAGICIVGEALGSPEKYVMLQREAAARLDEAGIDITHV